MLLAKTKNAGSLIFDRNTLYYFAELVINHPRLIGHIWMHECDIYVWKVERWISIWKIYKTFSPNTSTCYENTIWSALCRCALLFWNTTQRGIQTTMKWWGETSKRERRDQIYLYPPSFTLTHPNNISFYFYLLGFTPRTHTLLRINYPPHFSFPLKNILFVYYRNISSLHFIIEHNMTSFHYIIEHYITSWSKGMYLRTTGETPK